MNCQKKEQAFSIHSKKNFCSLCFPQLLGTWMCRTLLLRVANWLICSYINLPKQTEELSREGVRERGKEVMKNPKWWFIKWCDYLCKDFHPPHLSTHCSSNKLLLWTNSLHKICIRTQGSICLINCHQAETKRKCLFYQNMLKIKDDTTTKWLCQGSELLHRALLNVDLLFLFDCFRCGGEQSKYSTKAPGKQCSFPPDTSLAHRD